MALRFIVFAANAVLAGALRDSVLGNATVMGRLRMTFAVSVAALGARLAVESR